MNFGIDLGGTNAKVGLVDDHHRVVAHASVDSSGFSSPQDLVKRISLEAKRLMKGKKIKHVGVGVAGDIDGERGVVRVSPNLGWKNIPLKRLFETQLKTKVTVDNDANVAAWGIYHTQVKPHIKNLMVITLGTGVGGGIILNGSLYRGATGSAGEVGHMTMDEQGRKCFCGNIGCLETIVGGLHLAAWVKEQLAGGRQSRLQALYKEDENDITPLAISQAARNKDALALEAWEKAGHALGVAVGNLIYVFNPQAIFFTGGVAQAKDLILDPMWKVLRTRAFKTPINKVSIKVAKEASHIGLVGAAHL